MNIFKAFARPEYSFRPRQIVHRIKWAISKPVFKEFETVILPWGVPIRVRPQEVIGSGIWHYGVFDLVVTEAISRLLDASETAVDIGANIGQMTSLMQCRAGPNGKVISFEPHPELFSELTYNIKTLSAGSNLALVELHGLALSDAEGETVLDVGPSWANNRGMSRITPDNNAENPGTVKVKRTTMDGFFSGETRIGVCKIDVEGHELNVLKGAFRLLSERHIRDIIFEDFGRFPSAVHQLLLDHGFTIFSLHTKLWKPHLESASSTTPAFKARDGANYLATLAPDRAVKRFKPMGWRVLK